MTRSALLLALGAILSLTPAARAQDEATEGKTGTIVGTVIDGSTAEPIIEAGVEVVDLGKRARTDLDGQFRIDLPPGTYQVRFFAPLYQGARVQKVVVAPGKVATTDVSLQPSDAGVEVVEVVAEADQAAEVAQILERKKAAVVSDNVSAEVIRKTPDSDASEVVQRVPSVTLRNDSFIVVRGLNERYSRALLNGSRLPSPDPERRAVPLDLFPANFVESISVAKSYTPDLPGDFSAGLAGIQLKSFPDRRTFSLGLSTSVDTQATFNRFETYKGGGYDWFGFDQNVRSLPRVIPDSLPNDGAQRQFFGRSFKNIWDVDSRTAPPNYGMNFSVGDRIGNWGFYLGGLYDGEHKFRKQTEITYRNNGTVEDPEQRIADDFVFDVSTFETELGGLFTTSYQLAPQHQVSLNTLYKRVVTDQVLSGVGQSEQFADEQTSVTLDYEKQELAFWQVVGEHRFEGVHVDWRTALGRTVQERPDTRFENRVDGRFGFQGNGGIRAFSDLTEWATDSALDITIPFETQLPFTDVWKGLPAKFKMGPAYSFRDRDSDLRRFRFRRGQTDLDPELPTEVLLAPENIGPQGYQLFEETKAQDSFAATEEIAAGYAMIDTPLIEDKLRLAAGVRTEYSLIRLDTFDVNANVPTTIRKKNVDPLPGVNLIYTPRSDMNVRLGWSMTVARPEFRELSPAVFPRPKGLRPIVGNPALEQSDIMSLDLRWEWFFTPTELVSLSVYYKEIDSPIEQIVISQGGTASDSFANADSADLYGFELELRKNLGFTTPYLRNANFITNISWSDSEVSGTGKNNEFAQNTTDDRPLQGQTDWIINAAFEYVHDTWGTARLLYNYVGESIYSVGGFGLDDILLEPRSQLDFVYLVKVDPLGNLPVNLKFSVENILDYDVSLEQGGRLQRKYNPGVKFGFGITYNY